MRTPKEVQKDIRRVQQNLRMLNRELREVLINTSKQNALAPIDSDKILAELENDRRTKRS